MKVVGLNGVTHYVRPALPRSVLDRIGQQLRVYFTPPETLPDHLADLLAKIP